MAADFTIKQNDTGPPLVVRLADGRSAWTIDGADTIAFTMVPANDLTTPKINKQSCSIEDASNNDVRYDWGANDTDTVGMYYGEIEVTFNASGDVETFPADGYLVIEVENDLA